MIRQQLIEQREVSSRRRGRREQLSRSALIKVDGVLRVYRPVDPAPTLDRPGGHSARNGEVAAMLEAS